MQKFAAKLGNFTLATTPRPISSFLLSVLSLNLLGCMKVLLWPLFHSSRKRICCKDFLLWRSILILLVNPIGIEKCFVRKVLVPFVILYQKKYSCFPAMWQLNPLISPLHKVVTRLEKNSGISLTSIGGILSQVKL